MQFLYKFEAMTTPCEVILFVDQKEKADEVAKMILHEAKRLEKKYNYYAKESYLSALNSRKEAHLDHESKSLLQLAKHYYRLTEGVFDVTVATIKDLYASHDAHERFLEAKSALLPYVGCDHFEIKKEKLIFDNPFTKIDLGGFVKEYAVDQAVKIVKKAKISSALINFGGDIYALGHKPNGEKYKIGIKNPQKINEFSHFVQIENKALATSASYERNHQIENVKYSHVLGIHTHVDTAKSVTVVSPTCLESGVFSTAILINSALKTDNFVLFC